jgi:hypothetical protein
MKTIQSKIILAMKDKLPQSVREIAQTVRGEKNVNRRKCEAHCVYQLDLLEEAEITQSFYDGKRKLYKLRENVEILKGEIELRGKDEVVMYKEKVGEVLRMTNSMGEILLKILA